MMKNRYRLVALAIVAVLLLGEAFARFALGLGDPPLSISHPTIEYMFRPDQDVRRFGNRFIVNAWGMRSEPFSQHRSGDETRIMIFGDSVLNGGNLTDHADLATTLLQQQLERSTGRRVVVGNISAGSWGPGNWLAHARQYGFFDADTVVLVISSHDAADNPTFAPLDPDSHPQTKPVSALVEGLTRYLPRYLKKAGVHAPEASSVAALSDDATAAAIQRGLSDLRKFLALALAQTPRVFVVQHAEREEVESGQFESGHAAIERMAIALGVPVIQLAPAFREALGRGEQPYRDNIHPNEIGQRLIASVLAGQLAAQ